MEDTIESIVHELHKNDEMVHRRIDQEIDRVDQIHENCIRYIDSRVDKLDAKFCSHGKYLTEKSKELLKG